MAMKKILPFALIALMLVGVVTWWVVADTNRADESPLINQVDLEQNDTAAPPSDTAQVVQTVLPSVVNVRVQSVQVDPFGDAETLRGQGSGVVIDADGVIVTNFHVISGATEVQVVLQDGRELTGTVVGGAPENDIAVIKVDAENLDPIGLGKSSNLRLGDDVVAVGFPLALGDSATVTKGIVSATGRTIEPEGAQAALTGVIQTDAAINPGNSGGALVDMNGRLVGINSAAAGAATAENIGFAIPVDEALSVVRDILSEPQDQQAWMGVSILDLTPEAAAQLSLDTTEGVLVAGTFNGSPAEDAGMQEGDVIVAIDGTDTADTGDLADVLDDKDPGDTIEVQLIGSGGERTVQVELAQRPAQFEG
jgi:S1-C subfamily serine protease